MKQILVLKHMPSQNPGIFRQHAPTRNVFFTEIDLHAGDTIPDLANFDALWAMGGSMDVWEEDQHPWLVTEKKLIREAVLQHELPFLGICLGHQLLAEACGGKVEPSVQHELGLFAITPTPEGQGHPLLANLPQPSMWVNAHRAEVTMPAVGASILAQSEACPNHVMQIGAEVRQTPHRRRPANRGSGDPAPPGRSRPGCGRFRRPTRSPRLRTDRAGRP